VIIKISMLRFWWNYPFWDPLSPKKWFITNVCPYVCLRCVSYLILILDWPSHFFCKFPIVSWLQCSSLVSLLDHSHSGLADLIIFGSLNHSLLFLPNSNPKYLFPKLTLKWFPVMWKIHYPKQTFLLRTHNIYFYNIAILKWPYLCLNPNGSIDSWLYLY